VLLLEYPYSGSSPDLASICGRLRHDGLVPVIAHPERNETIQRNPTSVGPLVEAGALLQITAASVDGRLGRAPAACSRRLIELELAHLIASDAHAPDVRHVGLSGAVDAVGSGALAEWLTRSVPEAILEGADLPARPVRPHQRRWFFGRNRR
jgi:protein-tyrosine phosphatase